MAISWPGDSFRVSVRDREAIDEAFGTLAEGVPPDDKHAFLIVAAARLIALSNRQKQLPGKSGRPALDPEETKRWFDEFWETYPKKVGKADARKAFAGCVAKGVSPQRMIDGAKSYARVVRSYDKREERFIPHPATWLKQERYDDDQQQHRRGTADQREHDEDIAIPSI